MIEVVATLTGVLGLLLLAETLRRGKVLQGENYRKFIHITVGTFAAFWPWLISWRAIQIIGGLLLLGVLINNRYRVIHLPDLKRGYYGEVFFALSIVLIALLTTVEIFFTVAILHMALADGLAAIVGKLFKKKWYYRIWGQTSTVIGSMTFWFISLSILGIGLLFANDIITFSDYSLLLVALPPALTLLEAISIKGTDNITVPLAVLLALHLAQTA